MARQAEPAAKLAFAFCSSPRLGGGSSEAREVLHTRHESSWGETCTSPRLGGGSSEARDVT